LCFRTTEGKWNGGDNTMTVYPLVRDSWFRRWQEGGTLFSTIAGAPQGSHVGLGATADAAGNPHLFIGSCLSLEGNSFRPVFEVDFAAALVRVLGQNLIVP
jgi:hypothetical protein